MLPPKWKARLYDIGALTFTILGAGLLLGYRARWAAVLLILGVIPITITIQIGRSTLGPLFKNVAIMGGLLFFATHGAGPYSLNELLQGHQKSP
jgi:putative oxidoreductase